LKAIDEVTKQAGLREKKNRKEAEVVKERIEKLSISVEVLVGEEEKLFGSVTAADITELLKNEGVIVDKRMIVLENPIKVLGVYTIPIKITTDVEAGLKLWVIKKS
jgi:large subunit ribosomal protein L9